MKERIKYAALFFATVLIEVLIALFIHDRFVRPYVGDVLVVFVLYYLVRIIIPKGQILLPLYVFVFSAVVECLQYNNIFKIVGLENNRFLRVLIGSVFDWNDIACYAIGCGILMCFEVLLHKKDIEIVKEIVGFIGENKFVTWSGIISLLYCLLCSTYKALDNLFVADWLRPYGELMFNVAISVIAAVIFFIVEVYLVNRKKNAVLKKYAKRYVKEKVLKDCNYLNIQVNSVRDGNHTETEIADGIAFVCEKIHVHIGTCMNDYLDVLPIEVIDRMNAILFDDFFDTIELRVNKKLSGETLKQIVDKDFDYNRFFKYVEVIKSEIEKI